MSSVPKEMKAAVLTGQSQPLEIKNVPVPEAQPGEILIKVHACGATLPAHPEAAVRIPTTADSAAVAPLLCAGVTVFNGLRQLNLVAGGRHGRRARARRPRPPGPPVREQDWVSAPSRSPAARRRRTSPYSSARTNNIDIQQAHKDAGAALAIPRRRRLYHRHGTQPASHHAPSHRRTRQPGQANSSSSRPSGPFGTPGYGNPWFTLKGFTEVVHGWGRAGACE
ncbi:alcohol dehydrogenase like [Lecanosticta acicola]|uniref:Alcohol dehydrogenase like n=1 Tax=Lecanosticta acicola TaxID=111012 RepID=A0AAI8Z8G8_9PEZI|nr:alcohol dehydrogenase like [Lecanosticta acicola]